MSESDCLILTHRGLEPSNNNFYPESSYEAFQEHLSRGFGIEFDVNFTKDGITALHDSNFKRITNGKDDRDLLALTTQEAISIYYGEQKKGRISSLTELFDLIRKSKPKLNAMHLKGKYQSQGYLNLLISLLNKNKDVLPKILIFDVKPETARYLKSKIPDIILAPSVAHPYDIKRYNSFVGATLISVQEALAYRKEGLYEWVWLDEWDTLDIDGKEKRFYTREVFSTLRREGYKIALVTPELHGTSPGLYGGESHKDARTKETLFTSIKDILKLKPDAICTDYPEEARA